MSNVVVTHEMGFAREVLSNPKEARTRGLLEQVL